jgi:hypothetical protein
MNTAIGKRRRRQMASTLVNADPKNLDARLALVQGCGGRRPAARLAS